MPSIVVPSANTVRSSGSGVGVGAAGAVNMFVDKPRQYHSVGFKKAFDIFIVVADISDFAVFEADIRLNYSFTRNICGNVFKYLFLQSVKFV